jgi:hypothetical protein
LVELRAVRQGRQLDEVLAHIRREGPLHILRRQRVKLRHPAPALSLRQQRLPGLAIDAAVVGQIMRALESRDRVTQIGAQLPVDHPRRETRTRQQHFGTNDKGIGRRLSRRAGRHRRNTFGQGQCLIDPRHIARTRIGRGLRARPG